MKIAIDIDGVLLDVITPIMEVYNKKNGTSLKFEDFKNYDFHKTWGGTFQESVDFVNEFLEMAEYANLNPFPDSVKCVTELSKNHELIIITNRPEAVKIITEKQIHSHFPNCFELIHFTNQYDKSTEHKGFTKGEILSKLNADVIVEDCLEHILDLPKNVKGILLDRPWNQGDLPENVTRANSWEEVLGMINNI